MRIAVIGSGARENALAWSLNKDRNHQVWVLPGNAGWHPSVSIQVDDFPSIEKFCIENKIELIVAGQEKSLALGIQDILGKKFCVFGPSREAARLESSKIWAKQFMERNSVLTAPFSIVTSTQEAKAVIDKWKGDCVIKWDGLAAGKGVAVCSELNDAHAALDGFLSKFSSTEFVIERRLKGREISVFIATNGRQYVMLPPAKDYKRAFDQDEGPNTGGMGAVSCDSLMSDTLKERIKSKIIDPTLQGLQKENIPYMGFLYFGLMICEDEPFLLEYNVRLGDPEASAILARLETSVLDIITACMESSLDSLNLIVKEDPSVAIVIASNGYPESYKTGYLINGLENVGSQDLIFHAGTKTGGKGILSSGGRILNCVACGTNIKEARSKAYGLAQKLDIAYSFYRQDIGEDCFEEESRYLNIR